jgi:cytochrome b pre-mRNA-processing protein 3
MLRRLFQSRTGHADTSSDALYGQIVAAARQETLFADWEVPDTPIGRFEMVALFMILALRRLSGAGAEAQAMAQSVTDLFFRETDRALRDLGIGDARVPRRMKDMAGMFYGRAKAYGDAIGSGDADALAAALSRNIRPDVADWSQAQHLARYVLGAAQALAQAPVEALADGSFIFPTPDAEG